MKQVANLCCNVMSVCTHLLLCPQVGTCHMLSSYKRWIRAELLASQGKQKTTKCFKSYSNYGRYRDPKTALITKKKRRGTPKKNLGFICVGADFIPETEVHLYHTRAYYSQIRMIKATFVACHNKDFNKRDLTCTKVTHSGPCKRSTICASSPPGDFLHTGIQLNFA